MYFSVKSLLSNAALCPPSSWKFAFSQYCHDTFIWTFPTQINELLNLKKLFTSLPFSCLDIKQCVDDSLCYQNVWIEITVIPVWFLNLSFSYQNSHDHSNIDFTFINAHCCMCNQVNINRKSIKRSTKDALAFQISYLICKLHKGWKGLLKSKTQLYHYIIVVYLYITCLRQCNAVTGTWPTQHSMFACFVGSTDGCKAAFPYSKNVKAHIWGQTSSYYLSSCTLHWASFWSIHQYVSSSCNQNT